MIDDAQVLRAAESLRAGALVVIPTDTVYGVAAHPGCPDAVARLYAAKGRPEGKPIPLLLADAGAVKQLGAEPAAAERRLMDRYWPGALTLVIGTPQGTEGVRVPDCEVTRALLTACGGMLRVTSANRSGEAPALTADAAAKALEGWVDETLDAGPAPGGTASTVVRVDGGRAEILRAGAVPEADIARVLAGVAGLGKEKGR